MLVVNIYRPVTLYSVNYGLRGIWPIRFEIRFERKKRFAGPYAQSLQRWTVAEKL